MGVLLPEHPPGPPLTFYGIRDLIISVSWEGGLSELFRGVTNPSVTNDLQLTNVLVHLSRIGEQRLAIHGASRLLDAESKADRAESM